MTIVEIIAIIFIVMFIALNAIFFVDKKINFSFNRKEGLIYLYEIFKMLYIGQSFSLIYDIFSKSNLLSIPIEVRRTNEIRVYRWYFHDKEGTNYIELTFNKKGLINKEFVNSSLVYSDG